MNNNSICHILCLIWSFETVVCLSGSPACLCLYSQTPERLVGEVKVDWAALSWPRKSHWWETSTVIKTPSLMGRGGKCRRRFTNAWKQSLELNYFNKQTLNWPNMQCSTKAVCRCLILLNSITGKQHVLHAAAAKLCTVSSFELSTELIFLIVCLNTFYMLLHLFIPITPEWCNLAVALQCEAYQGCVN